MILRDSWKRLTSLWLVCCPKYQKIKIYQHEVFDFKKEFPTLFSVNQEEIEQEQLAREQKPEEDAFTKKTTKSSSFQDFFGLPCGMRFA